MTASPIVERELRVAARKPHTFRVRFTAAAAAAALGGLTILAASLPGAGTGAASGRTLFLLLVALCFGLALLSGVLLTADCISREKRDGTLGFLFLTDLSGLDVVGGKFVALALVPLHGLLAVFPVAAMTVFLGGVTGGELTRATFAITNTLFVSLAAGMWVSALVDDERQAIGLTVAMLALLCGLPELSGWLASLGPAGAAFHWTRLASPLALLEAGLDAGGISNTRGFAWALLGQHALGWSLLATSAAIVRHSWRTAGNRERRAETAPDGALTGHRRAARKQFAILTRRGGPIGWLACQGSWVRWTIFWLTPVIALVAIGVFGFSLAGAGRAVAYERSVLVFSVGHFVLKLLLATHAVYFLQDLCRRGTMELLLTTPLTNPMLCEGHFAAMRWMIARPAAILILLQTVLSLVSRVALGGDWPSVGTMILVAVAPPLAGGLIHAADYLAVAYHASRWALFYDRPAKALLRTVLLVLALPVLFCGQGRVLVSLLVIGQHRPVLERFRERVREWFFPGVFGPFYSAPRSH